MSPSLAASHVPRYAQLAALLMRHREAALGLDELEIEEPPRGAGRSGRGRDETAVSTSDADALVAELESMGPTFVKLGQLLSTRADLLPQVYLNALGRLQDKVEPLPPGEAERVFADELGVGVSKAFASFEPRPIASASLGQVHRAQLRDGRLVAVKVQRPGIRAQVVDDMEVVSELTTWLDEHSTKARSFGFAAMAEEFRRSITAELDYRLEASNLRLLGSQLSDYRHIVIPQPIEDFSSSRVLTMEYVAGRNISSIGPLGQLEIEGQALAGELFRAYLDQVLVHGLFHADPHPGNVLLTDDGRLALIDLGMVARLGPDARGHLLRLLLAVSEGQGNEAAAALEALGTKLDDYDADSLRARVNDFVLRSQGASVGEMQMGKLLGDFARASVDSGLRPPVELTMLGKAMLNLDEVACRLDAGFRPDEAIRAHAAHLMRHHMLQSASPGHLLAAALDAKDFAERLPSRLNKVLDALAEGDFTLNVEGLDEAELMRSVQKLANRCATGVVIAALVLAASVFANSKDGPKALGYPLLTIVFLGLAVVAAVWLLAGIVRSDLPQRKRSRDSR